jgi:hypothetical protein
MKNTEKGFVILAAFLVGLSGAVRAQDKRPDQAAIVDSFKQKIQDDFTDSGGSDIMKHPHSIWGLYEPTAGTCITRGCGSGATCER